MYAIIKTGGKQYKVKEGATLQVEKLPVEAGSTIDFNDVLLVSDGNTVKVGTPAVTGSKVVATVQGHGRGAKIKIIKFKRRKHHRKQMGHRQAYTELKITDIVPDINTWVPKAEKTEIITPESPVTVETDNAVDNQVPATDNAAEAVKEAIESVKEAIKDTENATAEAQLTKKEGENL